MSDYELDFDSCSKCGKPFEDGDSWWYDMLDDIQPSLRNVCEACSSNHTFLEKSEFPFDANKVRLLGRLDAMGDLQGNTYYPEGDSDDGESADS